MKTTVIQLQGSDDYRTHVLADLRSRDPDAARISPICLTLTPAQIEQGMTEPTALFKACNLKIEQCLGVIISDEMVNEPKAVLTLISAVQAVMPMIPCIARDRLMVSDHFNEFISRLGAVHEFRCMREKLSPRALLDFHTRYKMVFLAHSQPAYRRLGPMLADLSGDAHLLACALEYQQQFMQLLQHPATTANHTNVLMHLQGYFRDQVPDDERQQLHQLIQQYHQHQQPLQQVISQIHACMQADPHPHPWLLAQRYLFPWLICQGQTPWAQQEIL